MDKMQAGNPVSSTAGPAKTLPWRTGEVHNTSLCGSGWQNFHGWEVVHVALPLRRHVPWSVTFGRSGCRVLSGLAWSFVAHI
jgi:hypothetical protein